MSELVIKKVNSSGKVTTEIDLGELLKRLEAIANCDPEVISLSIESMLDEITDAMGSKKCIK